MVFLESEELGRYVDHLNHATLVLNPDLGSKRKSVREGQKRLRHKLRGGGRARYSCGFRP
jgi:hypothetical protein